MDLLPNPDGLRADHDEENELEREDEGQQRAPPDGSWGLCLPEACRALGFSSNGTTVTRSICPGRLSHGVTQKCASSTSCKDARASLMPTVPGIHKSGGAENKRRPFALY